MYIFTKWLYIFFPSKTHHRANILSLDPSCKLFFTMKHTKLNFVSPLSATYSGPLTLEFFFLQLPWDHFCIRRESYCWIDNGKSPGHTGKQQIDLGQERHKITAFFLGQPKVWKGVVVIMLQICNLDLSTYSTFY